MYSLLSFCLLFVHTSGTSYDDQMTSTQLLRGPTTNYRDRKSFQHNKTVEDSLPASLLLPFPSPPLPLGHTLTSSTPIGSNTPQFSSTPTLTATPTTKLFQLPVENVLTANQYRCAGFDVASTTLHVKGWTPRPTVSQHTHHMSMFFCNTLGAKGLQHMKESKTWDCHSDYNVCGGVTEEYEMGPGFENMAGLNIQEESVLFPFKALLTLGQQTSRHYIVIQVHNNAPIHQDHSGFELLLAEQQEALDFQQDPKANSFFSLVWDIPGSLSDEDFQRGIPPGAPNYELSQEWVAPSEKGVNGPFQIFMLHLHFHSIGTLLTVEYLKAPVDTSTSAPGKSKGNEEWTTIAQRIGAQGQNTYLHPPLELKQGDRLRATCHWDSRNKTTSTKFGFDAFTEEMCNVFLMCFSQLDTPVKWIDGHIEPRK